MHQLTPDILLRTYRLGTFPMAADRDDPVLHWRDPVLRGTLPLDGLHVPRSLRKVFRRQRFSLTVDRQFRRVIEGCAEATPERPCTWINDTLIDLYTALHRRGHAHSVETWHGDQLVGGVYGVRIAGAFFGESMFSRMTDASKVALVELAVRLRAGGFALLDTQYLTDHLARFGCVEITRADYKRRLRAALLTADARFLAEPGSLAARLLAPAPSARTEAATTAREAARTQGSGVGTGEVFSGCEGESGSRQSTTQRS